MLRFLTILCAFFVSLSAAEARPIPGWVSNLAETVHEQVPSLASQTAEHRKQVTCVALAVYYESRGESIRGQRAVAAVVMNRVRDPRFPDTPCEVLFQRSQFSFLNRNPVLSPSGVSWERAVQIAAEVIEHPAGEVPYLFFSSESYLRGHRIGNHVFR